MRWASYIQQYAGFPNGFPLAVGEGLVPVDAQPPTSPAITTIGGAMILFMLTPWSWRKIAFTRYDIESAQ